MQRDNDPLENPSRRSALACAGWIGTGMLWTVTGGIPATIGLLGSAEAAAAETSSFTFLQISDTHIGFKAGPYQDVPGTVAASIQQAKSLTQSPSLMLHTGDITHFSLPAQFDLADQLTAASGLDIYHVPGEHDMVDPAKKNYLSRYGKNTKGDGWYSFDDHGVHFIGLVNVLHKAPDNLWLLGPDQLAWLQDDLKAVSPSTPIVVFSHVPLWTVYEPWGWGTSDANAAMALLKNYGSVTVLNGHIHQIVQKVEGQISFHTARSTAFPQAVGGTAPADGPLLKIPAGDIKEYLGITSVAYTQSQSRLALTDHTLAA